MDTEKIFYYAEKFDDIHLAKLAKTFEKLVNKKVYTKKKSYDIEGAVEIKRGRPKDPDLDNRETDEQGRREARRAPFPPEKFENQFKPEEWEHVKDAIDKAVIYDAEPVERRPEKSNFVKKDCSSCGKLVEVQVLSIAGRKEFTCDKCLSRRSYNG